MKMINIYIHKSIEFIEGQWMYMYIYIYLDIYVDIHAHTCNHTSDFCRCLPENDVIISFKYSGKCICICVYTYV